MTRVLTIDASPRPGRAGTHTHGSHTRRLTDRFVSRWRAARPDDEILYRDLAAAPPALTTVEWIEAAFTPAEARLPWMQAVLAESDRLIDELEQADVLVLGVPMYNFGPPAAFKAWIDNIVRLDRTVDFDLKQGEHPYLPLAHYVPRLNDRPRHAVLLSSRGGFDFDAGQPLAYLNHLEPSVHTVLKYIGIGEMHSVAIEHQEEGGERFAASVDAANRRLDALIDELLVVVGSGSQSRRARTAEYADEH
ncbi:NAD(P)H dehydrogenase [Alkalilimnicola ehrlichii]|uniref:FMN dependent NADH:quinone oxidoreductase n=1 Tax=Alkalilimnicola ehrlichii TaxID=351052 RepID=A0A3E0WH36_9GAMM|nr:NAD(P)H-dependent oxidoreductase [Alkalilimnicola ehrlichii]RFA25211.1 NAD(P)H dehydrogenase [Alkalilimnicola ehrlichii]RFA32290.1 NAD(P)H dehydrogenase [Alkalilimnicola ehrlichii]